MADRFKGICTHPTGHLLEGREYELEVARKDATAMYAVYECGSSKRIYDGAYHWRFRLTRQCSYIASFCDVFCDGVNIATAISASAAAHIASCCNATRHDPIRPQDWQD